jgi:hypothetical protein
MKKLLILMAILLIPAMVQAMDVTLGWDANSEPDLAGYRLYWAHTAGGQVVTQTTNRVEIPLTMPGFTKATPQFTVTGLPNDKECWFRLTAYDTEGLESGFSNEVMAASWIGKPPKPPAILRLIRWILSFLGIKSGLTVIG